jgi:transcriptional regulator with XRE-family HTH domain
MKKKSEKIYQVLRRRMSSNLARLRAAQGLTQTGLADMTGLHFRHVQKIEAGESNVTLLTMARLASGLGVDPRELIGTAS